MPQKAKDMSDAELRVLCAARARVIKAISHPSRLIMLEELARSGEKCVCELAEILNLDMSTTSRHLAQMKEAGILSDEKRGQMTFYRLRTPCVRQFLTCIDQVLQRDLEDQLRLLR